MDCITMQADRNVCISMTHKEKKNVIHWHKDRGWMDVYFTRRMKSVYSDKVP